MANTAFPGLPVAVPVSVPNGGTGLATLTAHALYVGNGTSAPTALAVGAAGQVLMGVASADPSWQAPAFQPNLLVNSGAWLAQRQATPTTLTTPSYKGTAATAGGIDGYGMDGVKCGFQSATTQYNQTDTNGSAESNYAARYYGNWKQITNAGKFILYWPMTGDDSEPLANAAANILFLLQIKASTTKTIRLGFVQLNSSGTIDTIPGLMVPTTWGANSTDPTLGTNLARVAPTSVPTGVNGTVNGNAVDCSVTTAWLRFGGLFAVPAGAKNLMPAIWTDSQFSVNDILSIGMADLYVGQAARVWNPSLVDEELRRCYYRVYRFGSFANTQTSACVGCTNGGNASKFTLRVPVPMRASPTLTLSANSDFKMSFPGIGSTAFSGTPSLTNNADQHEYLYDVATSGSSGTAGPGWVTGNATSPWMILDADL